MGVDDHVGIIPPQHQGISVGGSVVITGVAGQEIMDLPAGEGLSAVHSHLGDGARILGLPGVRVPGLDIYGAVVGVLGAGRGAVVGSLPILKAVVRGIIVDEPSGNRDVLIGDHLIAAGRQAALHILCDVIAVGAYRIDLAAYFGQICLAGADAVQIHLSDDEDGIFG